MEEYTPIIEKDKKIFSFKRTIQIEQKGSQIFSFTIIKSEEDIEIKIKEEKENLSFGANNYEKKFSLNDLKKISRCFKFLETLDLIFESLKKNFDNKKDIISLEKQTIIIKIKINMDVSEDVVILDIPLVKKGNKEEMENLKTSLDFLNNENINLKEEMKIIMDNEAFLHEEVNDLKKKLEEMPKYINEKLNPNEKEEKALQSYYCEREIKKEEKEKEKFYNKKKKETKRSPDGNNISENNLIFGINILLFDEIIKIKVNKIQDNLKSNLLLYESSFDLIDFGKFGEYYAKNGGMKSFYKFLCDSFKQKKDSIKTDGDNKIIIKVQFTWGLEKEEISFEILSKDLGLEKTLSNLKHSIDALNKENKNLKNQLNEKLEDEINNINKTVNKANKEINEVKKDTYKLKIEFQKDLLERVYPVGSYYWSSNNISPEELFGGKWEQINGRFLFATDNQHPVGTQGGEQSHVLTEDEMPKHSHQEKIDGFIYVEENNKGQYKCPFYKEKERYSFNQNMFDLDLNNNFYPLNNNFYDYKSENTEDCGSNYAHNNMPPFLTAYCWRRKS